MLPCAMLLHEQRVSSFKTSKCVCVCDVICLFFSFGGTTAITRCFTVNMYIPAQGPIATTFAGGLMCLRGRGVVATWRP